MRACTVKLDVHAELFSLETECANIGSYERAFAPTWELCQSVYYFEHTYRRVTLSRHEAELSCLDRSLSHIVPRFRTFRTRNNGAPPGHMDLVPIAGWSGLANLQKRCSLSDGEFPPIMLGVVLLLIAISINRTKWYTYLTC